MLFFSLLSMATGSPAVAETSGASVVFEGTTQFKKFMPITTPEIIESLHEAIFIVSLAKGGGSARGGQSDVRGLKREWCSWCSEVSRGDLASFAQVVAASKARGDNSRALIVSPKEGSKLESAEKVKEDLKRRFNPDGEGGGK